MPTLTIDGQQITVEPGTVVIQAAEMLGIEIPRFCYHERLAIAGNCRMCLVEVSPGPPKPQASCALPCADNMVVKTNSDMVKKAREGVMEFLLINHPLDCPICDQGGECDLQDQALFYGKGISRYKEGKRSVEDKYMGPIIKTFMNRCIHCTRCVRFSEDVAGVPELGAFSRGEHTEIGTYVEKAISSELSGNLVDLCPVGALTAKPYAYIARPWELRKTESIDVMDAVGSNIRIDSRGEAVMRVLPRIHEDINEEWISDKTRHACDGLKVQRLDRPYVRGADGRLKEASWQEAFAAIAERVRLFQPGEIAGIAGDMVDVETAAAFKDLFLSLGIHSIDCRQDGAQLSAAHRGDFLFNTTIAGIEEADFCLMIGANPRIEAPLVNTRIRKAWMRGGLQLAALGANADLTYPVHYLGNDIRVINDLLSGEHPFLPLLANAKRPMMIVGMGVLSRSDGAEVLTACKVLAQRYGFVQDGWNGFNVLHTAAGRAGALEMGVVPQANGRKTADILHGTQSGDVRMVYLLGADEIDMSLLGNSFVVYQGHHGDRGAHRADVVLPGVAYTEKEATYVNLEGRPQRTTRAVFPPGQAKEDWAILRALSDVLGMPLPYNNVDELRARIAAEAPHLLELDSIWPAEWVPVVDVKKSYRLLAAPLGEYIQNFYMTDPISRASKTMAECTRQILGGGVTTGLEREAA